MKAFRGDISIEEFVEQHAHRYDEATDNYFREPFARDTKVGKNSAIYNAHSYHTKVPPEGIVPYLDHYTQPGDLVLDPFCGSGMTGIAALLSGRHCILNDVSPAACHIAYNYCTPCDVTALKRELVRILDSIKSEFEWLYATSPTGNIARVVEYSVWSDTFNCTRCHHRFNLYKVAYNSMTNTLNRRFSCPHCGFEGMKKDHILSGSEIVSICSVKANSNFRDGRSVHEPKDVDYARLEEIKNQQIPYWHPSGDLDLGKEMIRHGLLKRGITRFEQFYTPRNLWALARIWSEANIIADQRIREAVRFCVTATMMSGSELNRHNFGRQPTTLRGTLYIGSFREEANISRLLRGKFRSVPIAFTFIQKHSKKPASDAIISQGTADILSAIPDECIDYIFTDPPFGSNIFYSDCSLLWEYWLDSFTDEQRELVVNDRRVDGPFKTVGDYGSGMAQALLEMYRVLKPGRWCSLVFSNSDDRVWHVIRDGAKSAGFELANTVALDKKQRSFKQIKGEKGEENVVGTDIIMNLHKRARVQIQVEELTDRDAAVIEILRDHLAHLPERIKADPKIYSGTMRTTDALYSVILQALMQRHQSNRGITIPYVDDLCGTTFKKVQGCWYLPSEEIFYSGLVFEIVDEPSAITWIRQQLSVRAMTFPEIVPGWRRATLKISTTLEKDLRQLLEENFWHEPQTNRWRLPSPDERAQMSDERTLRLRRRLRLVLSDKADPLPSDHEYLDLMLFAYEHAQYAAVTTLYGRINMHEFDEVERKKARKLLQIASSYVAEEGIKEGENGRLF